MCQNPLNCLLKFCGFRTPNEDFIHENIVYAEQSVCFYTHKTGS